ncbi:MAG TPA: pectinesterase family protein, partial [Chitinophagaceae bacterium]|nr:pectinesterase family protein [Chitinophagaceae bacterium]
VYHEKVRIPEWNTKISMIGENKDSTIIAYSDYFNRINKGPNSTFYTATVTVEGNDFHAENLTIKNNAGPIGQAMALTVNADRCSFDNCRFIGNQDTIYLTGEHARDYFKNCYIEGTTDFIFGQATALFEKCKIKIKSNSYITAASTSRNSEFGFVFKDCKIIASSNVNQVYLGRPWRKYAKTVYLNCEMGNFIRPEGWDNWGNSENEKTVYYAEYHSKGAGANPSKRAKWTHQLTNQQAEKYTKGNIFKGMTKSWNPDRK